MTKILKDMQYITEKIEKIEPEYRAKIIIRVLTPEVMDILRKNREIEKNFRAMEELWELNRGVTGKELGKDLEEAIISVRKK